MKKTCLFLLIVFTYVTESKACDCLIFNFCDHLHDPTVKVAIQAEVIRSVVYTSDNYAVYLKVLKKYKDEANITDTIKIYGNEWAATCYVNVLDQFLVGDTVITTFGFSWEEDPLLFNGDSLTENYYELRPISCDMVNLRVQNGIVSGRIYEGIATYPLSHFENALQQCDFSPPVTAVCHYSVYPIPSSDNKVYVRKEYTDNTIEKIRLLSIDGRLLQEYSGLLNDITEPVEIDLPGIGIYLLEIRCSGKVYYKKVITM